MQINYEDFAISTGELNGFRKHHTGKVIHIWQQVILQLPVGLQAEAARQQVDLMEVEELRTGYTRTLEFVVPHGSNALKAALQRVYSRVILLLE